ncbi:hypothetical protein PG984_002908 [Apiospora sp. TS-2023a]
MRLSTALFAMALASQGSHALKSISDHVRGIPGCAHAALASAMAKHGCATTTTDIGSATFDCLCKHRMVRILISAEQPPMSLDCCRAHSDPSARGGLATSTSHSSSPPTWPPQRASSGWKSLSEDVEDIPSCSHAALASAMTKEQCTITDINSTTFDCLCRHMTPILISVQHAMSVDCATEFASAIGHVCGMWNVNQYASTTASDLAAATSILGTELGAAAPAPTAVTSSKAAAAGTTARPVVGYVGAAVAAAVML